MLPYQLNFRYTPAIVRRTLALIPIGRGDDPAGDDGFTLREIVAHLADTEEIFSARMRAAVAEDVPEFGPLDMAGLAVERRYSERDPHAELARFTGLRAETVAFLEGLSEAQWEREFVQAFGRMSVAEFLVVFTGHDLYHLDQLSRYLDAK